MTWHNVEWFMQYFANPLAAVVLLVITGWYAWTTRRIMKANETGLTETRAMVAATKDMADAARRSYLASLAPNVRVTEATFDAKERSVSVVNRGTSPVKLVSMDSREWREAPDPAMPEEVGVWILPGEDRRIEAKKMRCPTGLGLKFVLEDVAGQQHDRVFGADELPDRHTVTW